MKDTRRHRYITFHVDQDDQNLTITNSQFIQELRQHAFEIFSKSVKDLRLWVIQFDGTSGILKCHYTEKENVIQLLVSIKKIGTKPVSITTCSTSGTIRGLAHKKQTNVQ
jgi:RNase P/RNase MRP subunit POP5